MCVIRRLITDNRSHPITFALLEPLRHAQPIAVRITATRPASQAELSQSGALILA